MRRAELSTGGFLADGEIVNGVTQAAAKAVMNRVSEPSAGWRIISISSNEIAGIRGNLDRASISLASSASGAMQNMARHQIGAKIEITVAAYVAGGFGRVNGIVLGMTTSRSCLCAAAPAAIGSAEAAPEMRRKYRGGRHVSASRRVAGLKLTSARRGIMSSSALNSWRRREIIRRRHKGAGVNGN